MNRVPRLRIKPNSQDEKALIQAYRSNELVLGSDIKEFKTLLLNRYFGKYCTLTSNGFSSIFLAIKSLGLQGEKIVLPATSTCFAIYNAILSSGNEPVFVDVDLDTSNISIDSLKRIESKIKLIISPNHFGILSPTDNFKELGLNVIEDCAQSALSSLYIKSNADIRVFSFYPTKIINAIDGGAIITDNKELNDKLEDIVYYNHQEKVDGICRYNFRMSNLHASVGKMSIGRIDVIKNKYDFIRKRYDEILHSFSDYFVLKNSNFETLYRYIIRFNTSNQAKLFHEKMSNKGINTSRELMMISPSKHKNSQILVNQTYSVPLYEDLTEGEIDYICNSLFEVLKKI